MRFLLDTNVISEFRKARPHPEVVSWLNSIDQDSVYLSVITIGELKKGIDKLTDEARRSALQAWLMDDLLVRFAQRIVILDIPVLMAWGGLLARLERAGTAMPAVDSLIAAAALQGNYVLVTRNVDDFRHAGVQLFNPWAN
jgi:predicted nucleic acid-binding protein